MPHRLLAKRPVGTAIALDTASTNITTAAWVEIEDSTTASCTAIQVYNAGARMLILGVGAAGSEVDTGIRIPAAVAVTLLPIEIAKGSRLALKSLVGTQSSGIVNVSFFGR